MHSRRSALLLEFVVVTCSVGASPLVAEGVNASRFKMTLQAPGLSQAFLPVDAARLDEFCRDDDGCAVSLHAEVSGVGLRASEWRV
jgi:hypothetical protein